MKEFMKEMESRRVYVKKTQQLKDLEADIRNEQPTGRGTLYAMNVNHAITYDKRFIALARPLMLEKLHEQGLELGKVYEQNPDTDVPMGSCEIINVFRKYKNSTKFEISLQVKLNGVAVTQHYDCNTIFDRCIVK